MSDVQTAVIEILAEHALLEPSDVAPTATLEEIGLDSLGLVECIFAIEERFDVTVPFNANEPEASDFDISTVAKIVEGVETLIAGKEAKG